LDAAGLIERVPGVGRGSLTRLSIWHLAPAADEPVARKGRSSSAALSTLPRKGRASSAAPSTEKGGETAPVTGPKGQRNDPERAVKLDHPPELPEKDVPERARAHARAGDGGRGGPPPALVYDSRITAQIRDVVAALAARDGGPVEAPAADDEEPS